MSRSSRSISLHNISREIDKHYNKEMAAAQLLQAARQHRMEKCKECTLFLMTKYDIIPAIQPRTTNTSAAMINRIWFKICEIKEGQHMSYELLVSFQKNRWNSISNSVFLNCTTATATSTHLHVLPLHLLAELAALLVEDACLLGQLRGAILHLLGARHVLQRQIDVLLYYCAERK